LLLADYITAGWDKKHRGKSPGLLASELSSACPLPSFYFAACFSLELILCQALYAQ